MMYRVILDDITPLYGFDIEDAILNPSLEIELNSAGSFSFTLSPFHSSMKNNWSAPPKVLAGEIDVYEGDNIIWFGRPLEIVRDWNNNKVLKCEGALSYFNDTVLRPKEFDKNWGLYIDDDHNKGFFNYIIEEHNAMVTENHTKYSNREILVGNIVGIDNDTIYRNVDYITVSDALKSMCLDTNGGYFILRKEYVEEEGIRVAKRYIDWVKEPDGGTDQPAQFGINMVELNQDLNGSDIVTILIPTGEDDILINNNTVWDDDANLCPFNEPGFTFLHESKSDELVWKEGLEKYGRILKQKDWNDESDKGELQHRACNWFFEQMNEPVTIECTAADLHYITDKDYMIHVDDEYIPYMPFFVGQKVEVLSQPHDITGDGPKGGKMLPIYKININLDSGVKRMSIGTPPKRELTDIVKAGGGSTRSSSSGTSSGGSGGGSTVSIPVKDVRVKNAGDTAYKSVVKKKIAKIDLSDLSTDAVKDVKVNGTSVVDENKNANITIPPTPTIPVTDVQVDGTSIVNNKIANLDSSQFGTTVVANPSGTATDDLTKVQIGNTVYDIPGSGGSGGQQYTCDLLFENDPLPSPTSGTTAVTRSYTLNHSIDDYDAVYVVSWAYNQSTNGHANPISRLILKKEYYTAGFNNYGQMDCSVTNAYQRAIFYTFPDNTHISTYALRSESGVEPVLHKVYGLKFAASVINNPVFLSDYYDTDEQVVGRWIDGKPLYQKTVHYNGLPKNTDAVVCSEPENVERMIDLNASFSFDDGETTLTNVNSNYYSTGSDQYRVWRFQGNISIGVYTSRTQTSLNNSSVDVTMRYTKTTDVPNTGPIVGNLRYLPTIYSEQEREIGVWMDGKPLYQKSIPFDNTSASYLEINVANLSIDRLTNTELSYLFSSGNDNYKGSGIYYYTSSDLIRAYIDANTNKLALVRGNNYPITSNGVVTIQYTKTTDTPGSGSWQQDGTPSHLYSTTPHKVGKWIDGSDIWECSYDLSGVSISTGGATAIINNFSGVMRNVCGSLIESNQQYAIPDMSLRILVDNGTVYLRANTGSSWNISSGYLTIQYTLSS